MERYSDVVPYNNRKYWYFTAHGTGPGTIPKDLKILQIIESSGGDYICLDGILNTSELTKYDMKESVPPEELIVQNFLNEKGFKYYSDIWKENDCIYISIEYGDWKHQHLYCDYLMKELGYELNDEIITWEDGSDCYSADREYFKA